MPLIIDSTEKLEDVYRESLEFAEELNQLINRDYLKPKKKAMFIGGFSLVAVEEKTGLAERVVKEHNGPVQISAKNSIYLLTALDANGNQIKEIYHVSVQPIGDWKATPDYIKARIAPNEFGAYEVRLIHYAPPTLQDIVRHNDVSQIRGNVGDLL